MASPFFRGCEEKLFSGVSVLLKELHKVRGGQAGGAESGAQETGAGQQEIPEKPTRELLLRDVEHLAAGFSRLADQLVETAGSLQHSGLPPSEDLIAALSDASRRFADLRAQVLKNAHSGSAFLAQLPEAPASLEELRRWLRINAEEEEQFADMRGRLEVPPSSVSSAPSAIAESVEDCELLELEELFSAALASPGDGPPSVGSGPQDGPTLAPPAFPTFASPTEEEEVSREVEAILAELFQETANSVESAQTSSPGMMGENLTPSARISDEQAAPIPPSTVHALESPLPQDSAPLPLEAAAPSAQSPPNLADLYRMRGKQGRAEPFSLHALGLAAGVSGPDHPDVANSLSSMALAYHAQGKYAEAEPLYQRALRIREKALGAEHPQVATSLNNLAVLYRDQGQYEEAQRLWERSLAIVEKAWGLEHPKTVRRVLNLAELYYAQDKYVEAEQFYQRGLAILEKTWDGERPSLANYVALLRKTHRKSEAVEVEARISAMRAQTG